MSNEKTDDFLSWRGRLSSPDALPEQGLDDREQSWECLAERLGRRPARRGAPWWIAAACLLMALVPAMRFFHAGPVHVVSRTPTRVSPQPAHAPAQPAPDITPNISTPTALRAASRTLERAGRVNVRRAEFATIKTPVASPIQSITDTAAGVVVSAIPPVDLLATPAIARPNHALRIAYYNEINNPGPAGVLAPRQPAFLRLGVATEYSANTNPPLIKINISSSNH